MDYATLQTCEIFQNISKEEIKQLLICLKGYTKTYPKGSFLFHTGMKMEQIGIVLEGCVQVIKEDYSGNRLIFTTAEKGHLFGEAYACLPQEVLEVSIFAPVSSKIVYLNLHQAMHICNCNCGFHTQFIQNLVVILAKRNLYLTRKVEHMGRKTTKEKLLSYLSSCSRKCASNSFDIPFNRQELADYLAVERSAMSFELSKLQKQGFLTYHKNHFILHIFPKEEKDSE